MYGFWGEGHTWPFTNNPFPDYATAERTWISMFEVQLEYWTKTPLVTNTQPDFSRVGNSELVDQTVRSHNWLRTDTIFVENEQIEAISNRPPWIAAVVEVGMSDGSPESLHIDEGVPYTDNVITHVMDVGANYWSLWNFHRIKAENIMNYYRQYPAGDRRHQSADRISRRPSFVWHMTRTAVTGTGRRLRQRRHRRRAGSAARDPCERRRQDHGRRRSIRAIRCRERSGRRSSCFPEGPNWKGLKLKAEIEVKGVRHPVRWACHQKLEEDGSLRLRTNLRSD